MSRCPECGLAFKEEPLPARCPGCDMELDAPRGRWRRYFWLLFLGTPFLGLASAWAATMLGRVVPVTFPFAPLIRNGWSTFGVLLGGALGAAYFLAKAQSK